MLRVAAVGEWRVHQDSVVLPRCLKEIAANDIEPLGFEQFAAVARKLNHLRIYASVTNHLGDMPPPRRRLENAHPFLEFGRVDHLLRNVLWRREEVEPVILAPDHRALQFLDAIRRLCLLAQSDKLAQCRAEFGRRLNPNGSQPLSLVVGVLELPRNARRVAIGARHLAQLLDQLFTGIRRQRNAFVVVSRPNATLARHRRPHDHQMLAALE